MAFFASVNGLQIVSGQLMIPLIGAWTADLQVAGSTALAGSVQVVIGNLTLTGFVYRSETYGGQTRARLVAGAGGWRTTVQSQGYGSSNGVMLSTVLNDAAQACGETVNVASDKSIGNAYTRASFTDSAASDMLWQLVAQEIIPAWYIDPSGTTQVQAWPSAAVQTPFTVTDQKPDEGVVVIATEDYASWMPGCTFTNPLLGGSYTSAGVHYVFDEAGKFRFEVLTGATTDRFLGAIQAVITRQMAPTRFFGRYAYTVSNPSTTTVDASPVNTNLGLPDLQNVPLTGDSVSSYTPASGVTCHVMFLDGQPTQPICVWTADAPTMASLLGGTNPVARLGDQTQSFLPPTLLMTGTGTAGPFTAMVTIPIPISGVITQGSPTVNSA